MQGIENILDFTSPVIEGHFVVESLDADDKVVDRFEDHNMIMINARKSMAEIFAGLSDSVGAHRLVLGTHGCKDKSVYLAKDSEDGFVKERTRIFSETSDLVYSEGQIFESLMKGDIVKVSLDGKNISYFRYNLDSEDVVLNFEQMENDHTSWTLLTTAPYTYTIDFNLPGKNSTSKDNCNAEKDKTSPKAVDIVRVQQQDTSVIFTFYVDQTNGNKQYEKGEQFDTATTLFNEAGLYVNGRLFAMKTFSSRPKNASLKLKIVWTITF
jgi:hypothetical protein